MQNRNKVILKYTIFYSILISYIFGFFLRENLAGGAESDFINFTWPAIIAFQNNFILTIKNYSEIGEGSTPLFHILNAYLNPFTFNQLYFQASITMISCLNVFFFSQIIKKKFGLDKIDAYLYSSIFLLLPFFRSSAFWGLTENLGWLFLILAIKAYLNLNVEKSKNTNLTIFLVCTFSSLALYTRPYLVFFPIFMILKSIIEKKNFLLKKMIIYFFIYSLPGLFLIYIWGGSVYLGVGEDKVNFLLDYHNPKFIPKNLIIFFTILFFYVLPFLVVQNKKKIFNISSRELIIFLFLILSVLFLNYFKFFDYLFSELYGGGIYLKLNNLIFDKSIFLFLIVGCLGAIIFLNFSQISKNNLILLFSILFIYCTPKVMYQEYFEPLILISFFSLIDFKDKSNFLKKNQSLIFFLTYFIFYFCGSLYFRYYNLI